MWTTLYQYYYTQIKSSVYAYVIAPTKVDSVSLADDENEVTLSVKLQLVNHVSFQ